MRRIITLLLLLTSSLIAQQSGSVDLSELKWRLIGPFRGGRSLTAEGVAGKAGLYYFGAVGGGVWRTTDAGMSWEPIADSLPIASIGAVAVAPSDPNVIYVGTGEADMRDDITYGAGIFKSTDAGKTWNLIGLKDSRQIGRIVIDPKNANTVYVASLGHAYGANAERGVFKSTDGGATWSRSLHTDDNTGAIDLAIDPKDGNVIYAALWQTRRPPWDVYPASNGPGSGLYKSIDAGAHWSKLEKGLPVENLGRIGVTISPVEHNRVYLVVDAKEGGLYRSDDAGANFTRADAEQRIWGRGWYFGVVTADTKDVDTLYVANTSVYKSTDGGKNFTAFKGAPGGDDYHSIWIAPEDNQRMVISSDQGTIVTLNGGKTWSSWHNQPTGQMYHVVTDIRTPYWVYGAQQDSGAIAVPSRSPFGSISIRDWRPIPVGGESGSIATDPLNGNIVYGGTVTRFDWNTWQTENVSPTLSRSGHFRTIWTLPLAISQADPHKMYFSHQMLFRTMNGGKNWDQISEDLTQYNPPVPANLDEKTAKYGLASPRKGVIYAIAPSPLDANMIWVGTDDGWIQVTTDDGTRWKNVTPKQLTPWSKVGIIDASHFDKQTAYAAIDRHRLDDIKPYIYRTHDSGTTWQLAANGIPEGAYVNCVREDTVRKNMLYAGTELGVFLSFDDGDHWQPLQNNLPAVPVRDIAIHENDLVIATHGRAFWVMDDIEPLRELAAKTAQEDAHLFKPAVAYRIRPGSDQGTPFPPEIAKAENPPVGAVIDYYLHSTSNDPVTLEIVASKGNVIRTYSSADRAPIVDEKTLDIPMYWMRPTRSLSNAAGLHRFIWDLHYASAAQLAGGTGGGGGGRRGGGAGPWGYIGEYSVRLTVDGKSYTQPLTLKMDPNVKMSDADERAQFEAALLCGNLIAQLAPANTQATNLLRQLRDLQKKFTDDQKLKADVKLSTMINDMVKKINSIAGAPPEGFGGPVTPVSTDFTSFRYLQGAIGGVMSAVESADLAPTAEHLRALEQHKSTLSTALQQWQQLMVRDVTDLNFKLKQAGLPELDAAARGR